MTTPMLLISDLDGTLLDSRKQIPPRAIAAIQRFVDAGGLFTIATGRTEETCRLATDILPVNAPVILYNGASVMDLQTGTVLHDRTFSAAAFRPLIAELMARFPDLCIQLFAYGPLILVNPSQVMDPYIIRENQPHRMLSLSDTPEQWLKIMLSAPHSRLCEVRDWLDTVIGQYPACSRFFSADYYYELLPEGCTKGACAQWLANALHLSAPHVAAIGDHLNDLELLRWAGHSFVPSNAHALAQAEATVLPSSNDSGAIADAIELLLEAR